MSQENSAQTIQPKVLNVRSAAAMLGISRTKAFELLKNGDLRAIKIGGKLLFKVSEIDRLIAEATPARQARQ